MKKISVLLVCLVLLATGCAYLKLDSVAQDLLAYNLGAEYAIAYPERVPDAVRVCDAIIESQDNEFIGQLASAGLLELSEQITDARVKRNVKRLSGQLKIELPISQLDIPAIKMAAESFRDGLNEL